MLIVKWLDIIFIGRIIVQHYINEVTMKLLNLAGLFVGVLFSGSLLAAPQPYKVSLEDFSLPKAVSQQNLSIPDNYLSDKNLRYKVTVYQSPVDGTADKLLISQEFIYTPKNEIVKVVPFNKIPYTNIGTMNVNKDPLKSVVKAFLDYDYIRYSELTPRGKAFLEQNAKETPIVLFNAKTRDGDDFVNVNIMINFIKNTKYTDRFRTEVLYDSASYNDRMVQPLFAKDYIYVTQKSDLFIMDTKYSDKQNGYFNQKKFKTEDGFTINVELINK